MNPEYEAIALKLLAERKELAYIKDSPVKIVYLESNSIRKNGKGNLVFGQCEKVPAKYRWKIDADFTITLFSPNIEHFDTEKLEILIFHELLHVGIERVFGDYNYFIQKHDLEDFKVIIDLYGTNWSA